VQQPAESPPSEALARPLGTLELLRRWTAPPSREALEQDPPPF
jgi:hypothetical protein